jgi:23S rRNA pseudouridine1911/1915/1917 synthase
MLNTIFEDNHLLVLNKPAGLLTQPSGTEQDSLESQAKAYIKVIHQKPGNVFLEAVHRLDKPVSGVVVFGKTSKALSRLNATVRAKQTRKIYWALVEGALASDEGILEHFLLHDEFHARVVEPTTPGAKLARLAYKVLKRQRADTLVEIELETGRYHQIRLQFASFGHPIWGDLKYGSHRDYPSNAIALHHRQLQLAHPITQEVMVFEAPFPQEFCLS